MTEVLLPGVSSSPCPKLRCAFDVLAFADCPLASLNVQGSLLPVGSGLFGLRPVALRVPRSFSLSWLPCAARLPLSLAKSFPPWRRPWGLPLQSLFPS